MGFAGGEVRREESRVGCLEAAQDGRARSPGIGRDVVARIRNRHFFLLDLLLLPAGSVLAFVLRLDLAQLEASRSALASFLAVSVPVKLLVFFSLGLYGRLWQYASVDEMVRIAAAAALSELITTFSLITIGFPLLGVRNFARSIFFIDGILTMLVAGAPRFAMRFASRVTAWGRRGGQRPRRVLVVGAGDAGAMIVREMREMPHLGLKPVAFVDDKRAKHGMRIHGVPVAGDREAIPDLVARYNVDEVVIAMPSAPGSVIRDVVRRCERAGVPTRIVPAMEAILSGTAGVKHLREVRIEDLLRREPVRIDGKALEGLFRGTCVLVTGAGGSIGSELCRQIVRMGPARLVALGHGENSIFDVVRELQAMGTGTPITPVVADARDVDRMRRVFLETHPQTVFHSAAHKHVPLMEYNVSEAVTNNVLGTLNVVRLCEEMGVDRLVYISTDKAVRPTSVMGATKRVGEILVQDAAWRTGRLYVCVRFGNVLGSRGSVVPVFREQIARGGPVEVTHPEVRRFFMTIPEAVQLVLQATAVGKGGDVILLDMGEPIKVLDLARDLIELSGFKPGEDIPIVFTGLRPGEKLYEELFCDGEQYVPTAHEKLFALRNGQPHGLRGTALEEAVDRLLALARAGDDVGVKQMLKAMVPDYEALQ